MADSALGRLFCLFQVFPLTELRGAHDDKDNVPWNTEQNLMKRTALSIPEIALIGGTRAALGAGLALLLGSRLNNDQRRAVGWTLVAVGAITTIPIAVQLIRSRMDSSDDSDRERSDVHFVEEEYAA